MISRNLNPLKRLCTPLAITIFSRDADLFGYDNRIRWTLRATNMMHFHIIISLDDMFLAVIVECHVGRDIANTRRALPIPT